MGRSHLVREQSLWLFSHMMLCNTVSGRLEPTPEKFFFTIPSDNIAAKINALVGKRVVLYYEQHKGLPGDCLGETEYFIKGAKIIDP